MRWCEDNQVDYLFGLARNRRLEAMLGEALAEARQQHERTGQPVRLFRELVLSDPRELVARAKSGGQSRAFG
jgi:hypothetical protein